MASSTERPVTQVLQDIAANLQEIVRSEVRLARAEIKQEAGVAARASTAMACGIVLAIYALGFLLLALVYGLALLIASWWIAALIVGAGLTVPALVLLGIGRARLQAINPSAERTIRTVRENITWDKHQKK